MSLPWLSNFSGDRYRARRDLLLLLAAVAVAAPPSFLAKPGFVTVKASSSNPPWKSYTFAVENLIDGKLSTSWQPKSKQGGVGEWVKVSFNGRAQVEQLVFSNAFQHQDDSDRPL